MSHIKLLLLQCLCLYALACSVVIALEPATVIEPLKDLKQISLSLVNETTRLVPESMAWLQEQKVLQQQALHWQKVSEGLAQDLANKSEELKLLRIEHNESLSLQESLIKESQSLLKKYSWSKKGLLVLVIVVMTETIIIITK